MSKDEWYSKLNKWAHEDSRLERMPLVYLRVLAEHIANEQAVEQSVHTDACPECQGRGWIPNGEPDDCEVCNGTGKRG